MLHPRLPPLVRALPHVEALSLFRAEEGQEEKDARQGLGLVTMDEAQPAANAATPSATANAAEGVAVDATPGVPPLAGSQAAPPGLAAVTAAHAVAAAEQSANGATRANVTSTAAPLGNVQAVSTDTPQATHSRLSGPSTLPRAPEPLPSPSRIVPSVAAARVSPQVPAEPRTVPAPVQDEEDEDEPMPGIDLGSDSEEE